MRAIQPTESGNLTLEGFRISYEVFGDPNAPAVLLLPAWQIVHSHVWKMQVHFLARSYRVISYDPPGNGGGERTCDPAAFEYERIARQGIGLLDHLGIEHARILGFSRGCDYGIFMAATWAERVACLVLIANGVSRAGWQPRPNPAFWERRTTYEGWQRRNAHYWREQYDGWLSFFFQQLYPEPHSTKGVDDAIGWAKETTPEILIRTVPNPDLFPRLPANEAIARIRCPVLIIHGDADRCDPIDASRDLAAARPDWEFVTLGDCGHMLPVRHPVRVNLLVEDFLERHSLTADQGSILH